MKLFSAKALRHGERALLAAIMVLIAQRADAATDECNGKSSAIISEAYPQARRITNTEFMTDEVTLFVADENKEHQPYSLICRAWPSYPGLLLVAVPLIAQASDMATIGDLEILVLDFRTLKVQQRLRLTEVIDDDAFKIKSITLDTARYQLTPGKMAFGLRITKAGSSQVNPFHEVSLSLYVIENEQLSPVLDGLVVSRNSGEWDGNCAGTFAVTTRTLSVGDKGPGRYVDILLTEKTSVSTHSVKAEGKCAEETSNSAIVRSRLIYDGKRYKVPEAMKPL